MAVIPFGLGSGVVGGVIASPDAILLDMGAMDAVRFIDPVNLLAGFDAGHNGLAAEEAVAAEGLTIGHWPQSVAVSSVGGWVATRASGQFSTGYGTIEDIVHQIEAVLPNGDVVTLGKGPRAAAGPDLRHLMLGSEGTLGVITGVTFSLRRAPEAKAVSCFEAPTMRAGFELQREIVQRGWRPPVMRQYDERESRRQYAEATACVIMIAHEGPAALVEAERSAVAAMAAEAGDRDRAWRDRRAPGSATATACPAGIRCSRADWSSTRWEVSADWSAIGDVYDDAVASLKGIEGLIAGSAHSSHVYRSGLNLYFTFAVQTSAPDEMEAAYLEGWRRIMDSTARHGGSVAHHHGIGRVRRDWLAAELGDTGVALPAADQGRALDPDGVMNPGVLLPDA